MSTITAPRTMSTDATRTRPAGGPARSPAGGAWGGAYGPALGVVGVATLDMRWPSSAGCQLRNGERLHGWRSPPRATTPIQPAVAVDGERRRACRERLVTARTVGAAPPPARAAAG